MIGMVVVVGSVGQKRAKRRELAVHSNAKGIPQPPWDLTGV